MKLMTQNIKKEMPHFRVVHDVRLTATQSDIIGWQEIDIPRYRQAIKDLPEHWDHDFGPDNCAQTISWRSGKWEAIDSGAKVLHEGEAGFTPTQHIHWVELRSKISGNSFILNNVHYVAGAWPPSINDTQEHRQEMWRAGNRVHRAMIKEWVAAGKAVAGVGDYNRKDHPVVGEQYGRYKVRYLTPDRSIDKIWLIGSAAYAWRVNAVERMTGRYSDHQGWRASVGLKKR